MKKSLIYVSVCMCLSGLTITDIAMAKGKANSNCPNADVVLSKKYPNFDLNNDCKGAYSNSGECDPDPNNSNLEDPAASPDPNDPTQGWVIAGTNGKNIIHGTSLDDTICGGNGGDEIYGEDGDDVIYGGSQDGSSTDTEGDEIAGGAGADTPAAIAARVVCHWLVRL